jgi:DNA-binding NarL/FixJ family response regulator
MHSFISVNLAILQRTGEIAAVNEGWKRFAQQNGLRTPDFGLGSNYFDHCSAADCEAADTLKQIRALLEGDVDLVSLAYRCDSPETKRAFVLIGAALAQAPDAPVALLHLDVGAMLLGLGAGETAKAVEQTTSQALADHLGHLPDGEPRSDGGLPASLSGKERLVLKLIGQGKTNKEIAALLSRSPNTIKIHVSHVLKKLKLRSRTEAALIGFKFGGLD